MESDESHFVHLSDERVRPIPFSNTTVRSKRKYFDEDPELGKKGRSLFHLISDNFSLANFCHLPVHEKLRDDAVNCRNYADDGGINNILMLHLE